MFYESIIGLEVHAQLRTDSKIFCGCSAKYGGEANSQTCPVCLGMPGVLPVLNEKAIEYAIQMVLAVGGRVNPQSVFSRKNYFYPDLPKGYQISQYDQPLAEGGSISIETKAGKKKINLTRIHLEEDAGKSVHSEDGSGFEGTLVDLNRCGVPLIEIVSQPDIRSPQEAYLYLMKLKQILEYLEICSGNMEEGSLRCDANVSVRLAGREKFGTKTEVKNMNSFRGVEKALTFEIQRQIGILEKGGIVEQVTMLWDDNRQVVLPMRGKEFSHDYRYFPEPDLVTLNISKEWLEKIKRSLPELPDEKKGRFVKQYLIPEYDAEVLSSNKALASYYEETVKAYSNPKMVSNWIMTEVLKELKEKKLEIKEFKVSSGNLAELLVEVEKETISGKMAKEIFAEMAGTGQRASEIIQKKGLLQITNVSEIEAVVLEVLKENRDEVDRYLSGKDKLFGFFVGEVMRKTDGKANPALVNKILREKLVK